jgi:ABC-2 type transport system permease protein
VRTLARYLRLYVLIETQYIKSRLQYRADFFISTVGMLFTSIATIFVFRVLFDTIPNLAGWSFEEILFIYAFYLLSIVPLQLFFDHVWQLRYHVIEGTFIKYYLRPMNMMFYYMSDMFDLKGLTQLALGIAALAYSSGKLGLVWTVPKVLLLLGALVSSSLVAISLLVIAACSAFWITNSFPVVDLALKLRDFSQYPTTIFDGLFRFMFTYMIPIGFVAFYPAHLFLRPGEATHLAYLAPVIGVGFFGLAYFIWSKGVARWGGTGS